MTMTVRQGASDGGRSGCPMSAPLVHLELHTGDAEAAGSFYTRLLGWEPDRVETRAGGYLAIALGGEVGGGIVECETSAPLWVPYVEVERVDRVTDEARLLGASVALEPREGPGGWRSVVRVPSGGEIALWQPKERR
jgi:predicted enzyme related to lactoylglutathione lyase